MFGFGENLNVCFDETKSQQWRVTDIRFDSARCDLWVTFF